MQIPESCLVQMLGSMSARTGSRDDSCNWGHCGTACTPDCDSHVHEGTLGDRLARVQLAMQRFQYPPRHQNRSSLHLPHGHHDRGFLDELGGRNHQGAEVKV